MTKFEEIVPKHVECESSMGGNEMGKHEDDCSDESSSMVSRCRWRGEAPRPTAAVDDEMGGGESGGEGGNGEGRVEDGHGHVGGGGGV